MDHHSIERCELVISLALLSTTSQIISYISRVWEPVTLLGFDVIVVNSAWAKS